VQSQAWKDSARLYPPSEHREKEPEYKLISIHTTLESANDAARAYAMDSEDLPGGGKRIAEEVDNIYDRDGLYACQLDFTRREDFDFDFDIADAIVRVLRKPLLGTTRTSTLSVSNAGDDKGRDHNAGKRKPEPFQSNDKDEEEQFEEKGDEDEDSDNDEEVQLVKEVKR